MSASLGLKIRKAFYMGLCGGGIISGGELHYFQFFDRLLSPCELCLAVKVMVMIGVDSVFTNFNTTLKLIQMRIRFSMMTRSYCFDHNIVNYVSTNQWRR